MSKETLIEKLRGYKSTPRHCEELCYEAANEIESLRQQLEIERMRNVACDVVAMADTPTSAEEARKMLPDYRSAALESVIRRVDECIALRQQLADKQAIIDGWLYANGPDGWIEFLRQQLAAAYARIDSIGETALNQQKQVVMLRKAMEAAWQDGYAFCGSEGLSDAQKQFQSAFATAYLDGLILCEKKPVAYMAVDSQGGSLFFRNEVLTIKTIPLYIALDQK